MLTTLVNKKEKSEVAKWNRKKAELLFLPTWMW